MKNGGKSGGFGYVGRIKNSGAQVVQAPEFLIRPT